MTDNVYYRTRVLIFNIWSFWFCRKYFFLLKANFHLFLHGDVCPAGCAVSHGLPDLLLFIFVMMEWKLYVQLLLLASAWTSLTRVQQVLYISFHLTQGHWAQTLCCRNSVLHTRHIHISNLSSTTVLSAGCVITTELLSVGQWAAPLWCQAPC